MAHELMSRAGVLPVSPSRTGLSTDSPPVFGSEPHFRAGTTVSLSYCHHVLRSSKEQRSMEPRQLRLPGFTRLWGPDSRPSPKSVIASAAKQSSLCGLPRRLRLLAMTIKERLDPPPPPPAPTSSRD